MPNRIQAITSRGRIRTGLGVVAAGCLALASAVAGAPASQAAAARPAFEMPFRCHAQWNGATYSGHGQGDEGTYALDLNKGSGNDDLGRPVVASAAGTVHLHTGSSVYGNYIYIRHNNDWRSMYAHLRDFSVKEGQKVSRGQLIGHVGKTGNAVTSHLHYEQQKYIADGDGVPFEAVYIWFHGKPLSPGYSLTYNGPLYTSQNC